jgi:hypothetical protein
MNRSKPSSVVGGGEMKRVTSSVVNNASSAGASLVRISRNVTPAPDKIGNFCRQSEAMDLLVVSVEDVEVIKAVLMIVLSSRR